MPPGLMPTPVGARSPAMPSNMSKPGKLTSHESYVKADVPDLGLKAGGVRKAPADLKLKLKSQ